MIFSDTNGDALPSRVFSGITHAAMFQSRDERVGKAAQICVRSGKIMYLQKMLFLVGIQYGCFLTIDRTVQWLRSTHKLVQFPQPDETMGKYGSRFGVPCQMRIWKSQRWLFICMNRKGAVCCDSDKVHTCLPNKNVGQLAGVSSSSNLGCFATIPKIELALRTRECMDHAYCMSRTTSLFRELSTKSSSVDDWFSSKVIQKVQMDGAFDIGH